jgi:hypothetical protein
LYGALGRQASARILRKKHMRALDAAVAAHKELLASAVDEAGRQKAAVADAAASELDTRLRAERDAEEARRAELRAALQRQAEEQAMAHATSIELEYEEQVRARAAPFTAGCAPFTAGCAPLRGGLRGPCDVPTRVRAM